MDLANPKDAVGQTKVPLSMVPVTALAQCALSMLEGSLKYGYRNYRHAEVSARVYLDAMLRHIGDFVEGEDYDPKTLIHNLGSVMACCAIIIDAQVHDTLIDDRDHGGKSEEYLEALMKVVANLHDLLGTDTRLLTERKPSKLEQAAARHEERILAQRWIDEDNDPGWDPITMGA